MNGIRPTGRALLGALVSGALATGALSAAAPAEALAAWTALARTYSGEPARKLVSGVLGTAQREGSTASAERDGGATDE